MNSEQKQCQNCKREFTIESEDFAFYKKINVPLPTWCSECRLIRRLSWRNERVFYARTCDLSGENIISVFSPEKPYTVYSSKSWWSDKWDALSYGVDYDTSLPFFVQFDALMKRAPLLGQYTVASTLKNSDYTNMAIELRDCYMVTNADYDERCIYGSYVAHSKDCVDCFTISGCERCYEVANCVKCYNTLYSLDCSNCVDVWFSRDLVGCQNCFGSSNLRNKQYYIWNKPYTKEEYNKFIKSIQPLTRSSIKKYLAQAQDQWMQRPVKYIHGKQNALVSGDYIFNSKNALACYVVEDIEDCKYCCLVTPNAGSLRDSYDCSHFVAQADLSYESIQSGHKSSGVLFTLFGIIGCRNVEYSAFLINSHDCFGCVSLRNKSYCILNKQYTPQEYKTLRAKIIDDMNRNPYRYTRGIEYRYGEFFPPQLSPFGYNETTAGELFSRTKEEAIASGFLWYDAPIHTNTPTLQGEDLPDSAADIPKNITSQIIQCEQTGKSFRLVQSEIDFYKQLGLPLPSVHPDVRHQRRLLLRNPFKLWRRTCMCQNEQNTADHFHKNEHCPNKFQTSYSPDRKEIVYCERCYVAEVA